MDISCENASSSTESTKATKELREKAIRFLNSPSIYHLPKQVKEQYLIGKGLTSEDIQLLYNDMDTRQCDVIWNNQETNANGHITRYAPHSIQTTNEHLSEYGTSTSNPIVPFTIGGMIAIVGLAAFRWLNGQDFVLFPKTVDVSPSESDDLDATIKEAKNSENIILNQSHAVGLVNSERKQDVLNNDDIRELKTALENLVQLQADTKRLLESERAAKVTDNAMKSLRKASNMNNNLDRRILNSLLVKTLDCKGAVDSILVPVDSTNGDDGSLEIDIFKARDISSKLESIVCTLSEEIKKVIEGSDETSLLVQENADDMMKKNDNFNPHMDGDPASVLKDLNSDRCATQFSSGQSLDHEGLVKTNEDAGVVSLNTLDYPIILPSREAFYVALKKLKESNSSPSIKSASQMLYLHISNLIDKPLMKQYRRISTKSSTFKNKIANVPFATQVLESVGFFLDGNFLEYKSGGESASLANIEMSSVDNDLSNQSHLSPIETDDLELLQEAAYALKKLL